MNTVSFDFLSRKVTELTSRLDSVEQAAHFLIVYKHQRFISADKIPERGWWHVDDLDPKFWQHLNASERRLCMVLTERCVTCHGAGKVPVLVDTSAVLASQEVTDMCPICKGDGTKK